MKTSYLLLGGLIAGMNIATGASTPPYEWTGAAADGDFFNEANWTGGGGPIVDDLFNPGGAGMLGGAGAYNITGADFSGSGFGEIVDQVFWDAGADVTFTNTTGRFQQVIRSQQTGTLTFDNSDLSTGALAEWNTIGEFNAQSGPFSNQWTGFLVNDSDILATNNGTDPNQGTFYGNLTISDTSSLATQYLSNTYITLDGASSELTLNGGGNPINQSIVNLDAVGASIHFLGETVDAVLAEHLYANSADQPQSGLLIGDQLAGNAGMVAGDLDGSGNFTNSNGVGFNLVTDGGSGAILTVTALPPAGDALTYTNGSGYWDRNYGTDWNNGVTDVVFFDGDIVTFDDSATGFPGTINVLIDGIGGPVLPGGIIVNNSAGNDYVFDMATQSAELFGNAPLTKSGAGILTFLPLDNDTPYGGEITIDAGVVELGNDSSGLRNASMTVNPGGTFRLLQNTTTQNFTNPTMTLAGGTLDIEDRSFFYHSIILADGTTSTINVDQLTEFDGLFTWAGPADAFGGGQSGNLIKTGEGPLIINGRDATYTGTTTIQDGRYQVNANRTAASSAWLIEGGSLQLVDDSGAPIENLLGSPSVSLTGGTLNATGNTETIGDLSMDSTSNLTTLEIDPATTNLTVANLDLTGTLNTVVFNPAITTSGTYNVLTYTGTLTGTLGTNLVLPQYRDSQVTWNDVGGVVTVTLDLSAPGLDLTYTGVSGTNVWDTGLTADWDDSGSPEQFFLGDNVTFDDSVDAAFSGTLNVVGNPVPNSVTFDNSSAQGYTLTGDGIIGATGLTKTNDGTVVLQNLNTYTGDTVVSGGTLVLSGGTETLGDNTAIEVNSGATLEITATNAITRFQNSGDAGIVVDGGTLLHSDGNHAHIPSITLRNGAHWTATSAGSFAGVNTDLDGDVTVDGTTPSTIGPFSFGIRFNNFSPVFDVSDVTGDSAVDLSVNSRLRGNSGFTKTGAGTMFIAANPNFDTDYTTTTVTEGCLLIEDLSAIPADLTQVSVGAGACFGGAAGPSNLTDADLEAIAASVVWDAGGDARLLIDTAGGAVSVAANLAGNFKIVAAGGGTLDLTGTLAVNDIIAIDGTTVNTGPGAATAITIDSITTSAGTTPGTTKVTIAFTADGTVDVYGSADLTAWGSAIATGVSGSPIEIDNVADAKQFFVLVSEGETFPAP
ncbi:hypothetical protein HAHE_20960 [Haloferula helveola]|uniref:Autotransporter-associated beta strand repeat-containing protein n=1 Tax=Haloferula helveola TaxID=490095 RepID=A0ABM7RDK5_9BACT|nr:hypothetical protein HAHE_20960 [Haloferula helveola]